MVLGGILHWIFQALIFSSGCGDDEKQVEPVDEYWIEWKNESDYRIDFFYVEGGYRWHDGINRGKYVSVRVSGSPEGLSDYIEGRETFVWYEQFVVDGETYAYMENYDPSGGVIPLCQRVCRTCSAILW